MKGIDLFVKILSQGKILTNKFGLFARILVCLSEFWFVFQHFGLFANILVCLPALWFVCQHFGLPICQQTNQNADNKTNLTKKIKNQILRSASGANSHLKTRLKMFFKVINKN